MRGFAAGDEIDFWPTWRSGTGKAQRIRATLLDRDEHGTTVRLDQESQRLTFLPWVQVRRLQKAPLPHLTRDPTTPSFRWPKPAPTSTEQPIVGHAKAGDPSDR